MKTFIIFALCTAVVFAHNVKNIAEMLERLDPDLKPFAEDCIEEMKFDSRLLKGDKEAKLPSVEDQSCFLACLDKKMGLVMNDGKLNESWIIIEGDPPEKQIELKNHMDEKVKKCKDAVGADLCKLSSCYHDMPKEFWQ